MIGAFDPRNIAKLFTTPQLKKEKDTSVRN